MYGINGDLDVIGKAGKFLNKALKVINYPHGMYKEEKKKHDDFKKSTLKPLERELETWQNINGKLEDIIGEPNESNKYQFLDDIKAYAKDANDRYRKELVKKLDFFENNGFSDEKAKTNLADVRDRVTETLTHYRGEIMRMNKEKAPSKTKLVGWGAATAGTYGSLAYIFLKRKFKK